MSRADAPAAVAALLLSSSFAWAAPGAPAAAAPSPVRVGVYVSDIQNLDLKSHSYSADVYFWFRWNDPKLDPAASIEFMNPYELWAHVRRTDYPAPEKLPDGSLYQVLRIQGRFSRKLSLDDYPFDRQLLAIDFEDGEAGAERMVFVQDDEPATANPELRLPGFSVGAPRLAIREFAYPTAFGDPRQNRPWRFSRVSVELPIERPVFTYSVKLLLPILCVIFCASLMFLFHPKFIDARVGIGITALLTIVALQITLNEDLPDVDYLVLMDKIYLGAYLFVIAGLAVVVKTTWMMERGQGSRGVRIERASLAALLTLYLAAMAAMLVF